MSVDGLASWRKVGAVKTDDCQRSVSFDRTGASLARLTGEMVNQVVKL